MRVRARGPAADAVAARLHGPAALPGLEGGAEGGTAQLQVRARACAAACGLRSLQRPRSPGCSVKAPLMRAHEIQGAGCTLCAVCLTLQSMSKRGVPWHRHGDNHGPANTEHGSAPCAASKQHGLPGLRSVAVVLALMTPFCVVISWCPCWEDAGTAQHESLPMVGAVQHSSIAGAMSDKPVVWCIGRSGCAPCSRTHAA